MADLVSIIVPVYNLEDYVENCLNSLLNQTYKNIEILCIDDGSSDKSSDKIKSLAEKDNRVVYFFKENGGESSARNFGLEKANGKYIMFVDGDDYIHYQAVEIFVNCITETKCDIVCADFIQTDKLCIDYDIISDFNYTKMPLTDFFVKVSDVCYRSSCGKLFTKNAALSARFPEKITNGGDTVYLMKVLNEYSSLVYFDAVLYYYYNRSGSASKSGFKISILTMVDGFNSLCDYLKNRNSYFLLSQALIMLYKAIFSIKTLCIGTEYQKQVLKKCRITGNKWLIPFLKSNHINVKTRLMFTVFYFSRHLYEFARALYDPTMKDFYKNRRKQ